MCLGLYGGACAEMDLDVGYNPHGLASGSDPTDLEPVDSDTVSDADTTSDRPSVETEEQDSGEDSEIGSDPDDLSSPWGGGGPGGRMRRLRHV